LPPSRDCYRQRDSLPWPPSHPPNLPLASLNPDAACFASRLRSLPESGVLIVVPHPVDAALIASLVAIVALAR